MVIGKFALIALRMTFGGKPNPSQWSDVSEMATDVSNVLARRDNWDPLALRSPHQHFLDGEPEFVADDVPFAAADPLAVSLPEDDAPKADCYIDDLFAAFLEDDVSKGAAMLPLVLHLLGRPLATSESLTRDDLMSLTKFRAEATPAEIKMVLGWILDTRRLQISLPPNKHRAWTNSIDTTLAKVRVSHKELEELIGRLNHAAFIIPMAHHFLGQLRSAQYAAAHGCICLNSNQRLDLDLWKHFLTKAAGGISMNLLTFRKPNCISQSDACKHGLGGMSVTLGIAWQWELPAELRFRTTLNVLEFMVAYITTWMDINVGRAPRGSCFLDQMDSTTGAGWIRKSNFSDAEPMHLTLARKFASLILDSDSCLYSQWFAGDKNDVTDSLSRDHHLSADALLNLLCSTVPDQIPANFALCLLPPELISKITTWMLSLPASMASPAKPTRSKLTTGAIGSSIKSSLNSNVTSSSTASLGLRDTESLPALEQPFVPTKSSPTLVHQQLLRQYLEQSVPPSMLWLRPLGLPTNQAPSTMSQATLHSFYNGN